MAEEASPAPNSGRCVYGFALLVLSVCSFLLYFVWAVVPGAWLVAYGLDYFSSKYFVLAIPVTCCVSIVVFAAAIYPAVNLMLTESVNCIHVLVDDHSRVPQHRSGIPPIWDMDVEELTTSIANSLLSGGIYVSYLPLASKKKRVLLAAEHNNPVNSLIDIGNIYSAYPAEGKSNWM